MQGRLEGESRCRERPEGGILPEAPARRKSGGKTLCRRFSHPAARFSVCPKVKISPENLATRPEVRTFGRPGRNARLQTDTARAEETLFPENT